MGKIRRVGGLDVRHTGWYRWRQTVARALIHEQSHEGATKIGGWPNARHTGSAVRRLRLRRECEWW